MLILNKLGNFPSNGKIFVDSNIIAYFLLKHPEYYIACKNFLKRVEDRKITAFVNNIIASEVYFIYVRAKLSEKLSISTSTVIKELKHNPNLLEKVDLHPVNLIFQTLSLSFLNFDVTNLGSLISNHRLLPNDALHLAAMQANKIGDIATNDQDFERIEGVKVWKP